MTNKLNLRRSSLGEHFRVGKELVPPFLRLRTSMEQIFWRRNLLPQFLWIDALVQQYGEPGVVRVFNDFLSAADRFNQHPQKTLDGTVGAFGLVRADMHADFLTQFSELVERAVVKPFGTVLRIYPECPMAWMLSSTTADSTSSLSMVRDAIHRLLPVKNSYGGFCRALPLNRLFAHRRIIISDKPAETIEAIKAYPRGDRERVESFARNAHGSMLMRSAKEDPAVFNWSRDFWRSNLKLATCVYG